MRRARTSPTIIMVNIWTSNIMKIFSTRQFSRSRFPAFPFPGSRKSILSSPCMVWSRRFDARRCRPQVLDVRSDSQKIISCSSCNCCLDAFARAHLRAGSSSCATDLHSSPSAFFCTPVTFHQAGSPPTRFVSTTDPPSHHGDA